MTVLAFVGPSLSPAESKGLGCTVLPPAAQGDVWRALARKPKAIALVDGVFGQSPSVWHHELRAALASGVAVFGASSMGALRAVELAPFGMIGVGEVVRRYASGEWVDDADVALLHADAEHDFRPLTVPLAVVVDLVERWKTTPRNRRAVLAAARALHFTERTWAALRAGLAPELWSAFDAHRRQEGPDVKARDARACLLAAAEYARSGAPAPIGAPASLSAFAREQRLAALDFEATEASHSSLLAGVAAQLGLPIDVEAALEGVDARWPEDVRWLAARARALETAALDLDGALLADGPRPRERAFHARRRR